MADWVNVPWPQPTRESVDAILAKHGIKESGGQVNVTPALVDDLTREENQVLSAFGVFGDPITSTVKGADFSRFSGVVGTGGTSYAYSNGKQIGKKADPNGTLDTVAFWTEAKAEA